MDFLKSLSLIGLIKANMLNKEFNELISKLIANNILPAEQYKEIIRIAEESGLKVNLNDTKITSQREYKADQVEQAAKNLR